MEKEGDVSDLEGIEEITVSITSFLRGQRVRGLRNHDGRRRRKGG